MRNGRFVIEGRKKKQRVNPTPAHAEPLERAEPAFIEYEPIPVRGRAEWRYIVILGIPMLLVFTLIGYLTQPQETRVIPAIKQKPSQQADTESAPSPSPVTVSGRISSYPSGASVELDFHAAGITPLDVNDLKPGVYIVSLRKESYRTLDTFLVVETGRRPDVSFQLTPLEAPLTAGSTVPEAGKPRSTRRRVSSDPVELATLKQDVLPSRRNRRTSSPSIFGGDGQLSILSDPVGASVSLSGKYVGETPLQVSGIRPDRYVLELTYDGYETASMRVDVGSGKQTKILRVLSPVLENQ